MELLIWLHYCSTPNDRVSKVTEKNLSMSRITFFFLPGVQANEDFQSFEVGPTLYRSALSGSNAAGEPVSFYIIKENPTW